MKKIMETQGSPVFLWASHLYYYKEAFACSLTNKIEWILGLSVCS